MSEGLTYPTRSQAEVVTQDLRDEGKVATILELPNNQFRVVITGATSKPSSKKKERRITLGEEGFEIEEDEEGLTEEEAVAKEIKRAARRLAVKKAIGREPEEIEKATLAQKREQLKELIAERIRKGYKEPGIIVPVFDPETRQIVDYRLETRGVKQRIGEGIEKEFRTGEKQIEMKEAGMRTLGTTLSHMGSVKGGMKASIPGQAPTPKAVIAALPQRDIGAIGVTRPAIGRIGKMGRMGEIDMDKAKQLYIGKSPLKVTPKTEEITANRAEEGDKGFAEIFSRRKVEGKQGE